jgi:hypothetical protein
VPVTLALVLGVVMTRKRVVGRAIQYAALFSMFFAGMATSRFFGPFVLIPQLIASYAIAAQAHPDREFRVLAVVFAALGILVPTALEGAGVLPASYVFADGTWTIVPQLIDLTETGTYVFLTAANLGVIVVPCMFIGKIREELSQAQLRLATQAWHFRQLGAQLIGRPDRARP